MLRQKELLPQDTDLVGGPSDPGGSRLCQRGGLRLSTQQEKPAFATGCVFSRCIYHTPLGRADPGFECLCRCLRFMVDFVPLMRLTCEKVREVRSKSIRLLRM